MLTGRVKVSLWLHFDYHNMDSEVCLGKNGRVIWEVIKKNTCTQLISGAN
jgi:hypothetical protein